MRKYELETIPIWDAYDADSECPLCLLEERAERKYIEFFLGNSVMIPEMRVEVNKTGFCPQHLHKLFASEKNRHGLGLVSHTHFKETVEAIRKRKRRLLLRGVRGGLGGGRTKKAAAAFLAYLAKRESSCMICDRLDYTLNRYTYTIAYLWRHKEDFATKFASSRGFCLHHLPYVLRMAGEYLGGKAYGDFVSQVLKLQDAAYERLEGELLWYTQKYDYQNSEKPWGTSKDALHRVLQKLSGIVMRDRAGDR